MKVRRAFVSNSSSSSFIARKAYLSQNEIGELISVGKEEGWLVIDRGSVLVGYTTMDNFDMRGYIEEAVAIPYAFAWVGSPGWAWTSLFKELGGKDLIGFRDDPDNAPDKPRRAEWIGLEKELFGES